MDVRSLQGNAFLCAFMKTKKTRSACTIILPKVSRRDLCYASGIERFCFYHILHPFLSGRPGPSLSKYCGGLSPPARKVVQLLRGVNPPIGGGRFRRGLPPAAAVGQPKSRFLLFQQLAKRLCSLELYRDSVQGGVVGLKSYCTVVEIHRAWTKQML